MILAFYRQMKDRRAHGKNRGHNLGITKYRERERERERKKQTQKQSQTLSVIHQGVVKLLVYP